ncbi:MAG: ferrous iron transport protein A [Lachnospiraceae bacterium]|nr:ferrous iron transport protein A [Lachnospiraceae bacterium]
MPLTIVDVGEDYIIKRVGGRPDVKKHLENLGFVPGSEIKVISRISGNIIVNVKETRIAISEELARRILV